MISIFVVFRPISDKHSFSELYTVNCRKRKNYSSVYPQGEYHLMEAIPIIELL